VTKFPRIALLAVPAAALPEAGAPAARSARGGAG
jgi:hypothetical protein